MTFERKPLEVNEKAFLGLVIDNIIDSLTEGWLRNMASDFIYDNNIDVGNDGELETEIEKQLLEYAYDTISVALYKLQEKELSK